MTEDNLAGVLSRRAVVGEGWSDAYGLNLAGIVSGYIWVYQANKLPVAVDSETMQRLHISTSVAPLPDRL